MSAPSRRWILRGRSSCKSSFSRRAKLKLLPLPGEVRAEPRPLKHGVKKEGAIVLGRQRSARRAWFARVGIFGLINQRVSTLESPPVRGRGSKLRRISQVRRMQRVAPRAGAWIETACRSCACATRGVAPRAGAWIETRPGAERGARATSPPVRGRGSKQQ